MNEEIMQIIVDKIGTEYFLDGNVIENSNVWTSEVNIITRTCRHCGVEMVGPDYEVWRMLASHEFGHAHDEAEHQGMEA